MSTRSLLWTSTVLSGIVLGAVLSMCPVPVASAKDAERHPKIHAALEALKGARDELKAADHDFGGHKKDAMEAVAGAIKQLKLADDFDRK